MKKGFWSEQWHKYRRKKTVWGITLDFLFTALLISMLFPTSRKIVSSVVIRYSMFQPRQTEEVIYVSEKQMDWNLTTLEGESINMKQFIGKPLFINLWATWCPPCLAEMPSVQRLYDEYGSDVVFIMASQEDEQTIRSFIEKKKYTFPVYIQKQRLPEVFNSRSLPTTFLLSPKGKVLMKKQGAAKWDGNNVKTLLNELTGRVQN